MNFYEHRYEPYIAMRLSEKEGLRPYLHTIWIKEDDQTIHYARVALDVKLNGNPSKCDSSGCESNCPRFYSALDLIANATAYNF